MSLSSFIAKLTNKASTLKNKVAARVAVAKQSVKNVIDAFKTANNIKTNVSRETTTREAYTQGDINNYLNNISREISDLDKEINNSVNTKEIFKFMLRNAGDPILSHYNPEQVNAFFAFTKFIWGKPEIPLDKRLDAIEEYFNKPLSDVFKYIIDSDEYEQYILYITSGEGEFKYDINFSPLEYMGEQIRGEL